MRLLSPQWVAVTATLVVVGGSVTAGYLHWHDSSPAAPEAGPVAPAQPGSEEASAVADALRTLASKPQSLVAADVQSAVAGNAGKAIPRGATVTPNQGTWHPDGLGGGTMTVTVASGAKTATYSAIMLKERTGWKVLGTVPMYPSVAAAPRVPTVPDPVPAAEPGLNPDGPPATNPDGTPAGTVPAGTVPATGPAAGQPAAGKPAAGKPAAGQPAAPRPGGRR